jgi:hypothetical protein
MSAFTNAGAHRWPTARTRRSKWCDGERTRCFDGRGSRVGLCMGVLRKNSMGGIDPSFEFSVFAVCTRCFTRRDRGVKLPRPPPSLPLCNSFDDVRRP